ncbi:MAG: hypothetical protein FGM14_14065 [Flavobacteriales bacterium]|nr:hypothetical protein [Flavobacteriales bacterium]
MQDEYYLTIDECPLLAWKKANSGDYSDLRKKEATNKRNHNKQNDLKAWEMLYNDFLKVVGLSVEFENYLELVKQKIEALNEFIQTRKRFTLNEINRIEAEIKQFNLTANKGLTIDEVLPLLSKHNKFHLRIKDLTVLEYFNYLKNYK